MTDESSAHHVLTRRDGHVLIVTLNRPAALNALDDETLDQLLDVLTAARASDVRAVVLTGSGRAFCAGADIHAPSRGPAEIATNLRRRYNTTVLAIHELAKPVIAAVNGAAAGAGLSLALAADLRIASDRASFVPAFVRIGSVPDAGCSYFATRLLGYSRAYDWLMSDRTMQAAEALEWGLVNEVVGQNDLVRRATERAYELAGLPGEATRLTKRLLQRGLTATLAEQLEHEVIAQAEAVAAPGRDRARSAVAGAISASTDREAHS